MDWLQQTLLTPSAIQAVIIICFISAVGLSLGKLKVRGIGLGVTFVFLTGIFLGALGLRIDTHILSYAESFGLVLFVYCLGLQVGPGFVSAFLKGGTTYNLLSLGVVALGTLMAVLIPLCGQLPFADTIGVLCGATTNTPALGAAQQTLKQLGQPASVAALSCAVTYAVGVVGVIIALLIIRKWVAAGPDGDGSQQDDEAFIASFSICNPAVFNHSIYDVASSEESHFVVSRLWRDGKVILPAADTVLKQGDRVLVITRQKFVNHLTFIFGARDQKDWMGENIDWNSLDTHLSSQRILITRPEVNGRHLGDLHLRNRYGVNVSRVQRAGLQLVATPNLVLRMGDRVTVIGDNDSLKRVAEELGNTVKNLDEPNMVTIFIGIVMGLLLGSIPFNLGLSYPVQFGLAGGPIIMGILIGAYGPRLHMVAYTTTSANLMMRSFGLSIYLACLGLDAGSDFIATVMQPSSLAWIGYALLLAIVPLVAVAFIAVRCCHKSYASIAGMLCGAMANPIALDYVNGTQEGDRASVAYATVYPLAMFLRVIIAQVLVMIWFA